ncbi:hypothetical protein E2C01_085905 [Portunus trituberculatus]|uniref:Uncharacterized protein n=1 Tax=Portunus trituberculatus TaxID=210409 RepID=A0A5B7IZD2_PORTR|nr:hypothetical protein [Portunus trituberculatus]
MEGDGNDGRDSCHHALRWDSQFLSLTREVNQGSYNGDSIEPLPGPSRTGLTNAFLPTQDLCTGAIPMVGLQTNQPHDQTVEVSLASSTRNTHHTLPCSGVFQWDHSLSQEKSDEVSHFISIPGCSNLVPGSSASRLVEHPQSSYEADEEDGVYSSDRVRSFHLLPHRFSRGLSELKDQLRLAVPPWLSLDLFWPRVFGRKPKLPRIWKGASEIYLPEGASRVPPPVNEELGGLRQGGNKMVSVSIHVLAQMESVCGSMTDIVSWIDQVLATWAGDSSGTQQEVLAFLFSLARANRFSLPCRRTTLLASYVTEKGDCGCLAWFLF